MLDRNPLADIRHTNSVRYVVKDGALFDADSLDTIWPETTTVPAPFWWETEQQPSSALSGAGRSGPPASR